MHSKKTFIRSRPALLAATCILQCAAATAVHGDPVTRELHVAPNGSDTNPGTDEHPVATLERARDLLRSLVSDDKKSRGAVVHVHGGTYLRTAPFKLDKQDSGQKDSRVVYQAEGQVRLLGGRLIPADRFQPVSDPAVKTRLPKAAREHVVELDLKSLGIKHTGPFPNIFRDHGGILQLFIDNTRMPLARWPNEGYTTIERVVDSGKWQGPGRQGGTFSYRGSRPAEWQLAVRDGLWLKGFWRVPWQPETVRVAEIEATTGTITHANAVGGGLGSKYSKEVNGTRPGNGMENWYALNLPEELDRPGEWCIRFPTRMLYLWPPRDLSEARVVIADMAEPLVTLNDVSHLTLRGFSLEGGLGNGVEITSGSDCQIAGCEIRNLGGSGVVIRGGKRHRVISCEIHRLGKGGIYVEGGDRASLTPASHQILNNHIHHIGQTQTTYAPAIMVGANGFEAVGCRIAHNLINDLPHAAVLYGGNDNIIEYNEIWRVALDSGDVGAFYTSHDWTSRGNILQHNLVADSPRCNAFYMDDGDSGDSVVGNVIWRANYGPFIGGGHDNTVTGNLIIDCPRGIHLDDRGISRGYNAQHQRLVGQLKKMNHQSPPWSERYPEMLRLLEFHPDLPTGNLISENVLIGCQTPVHFSGKKENRRFSSIKNNSVISRANAGLPERGNPIPALREHQNLSLDITGFKSIPIGKIGLYEDEFRQSLPKVSHNGTSSVDDGLFDSDTDVGHDNR